jgi:predicted HicB family RNase H-like nuclease
MPSSDIRFVLRIPVELDVLLRSKAEVGKRSLNAVICEILREGVYGDIEGRSESGKR